MKNTLFLFIAICVCSCLPSTEKLTKVNYSINDCFLVGYECCGKYGLWRPEGYDYENQDYTAYVLVMKNPDLIAKSDNIIVVRNKKKTLVLIIDSCKIKKIKTARNYSKRYEKLKEKLKIDLDTLKYDNVDIEK